MTTHLKCLTFLHNEGLHFMLLIYISIVLDIVILILYFIIFSLKHVLFLDITHSKVQFNAASNQVKETV